MYDYSAVALMTNEDYAIQGLFKFLGIMFILMVAIIVFFAIVHAVLEAKVLKKAGKPGWAAFIPVYNMVVLFQIANMDSWLAVLAFIPIANIIIIILLDINLAKVFGKSEGFAVGLILLNIIFMGILAFGKAEYQNS